MFKLQNTLNKHHQRHCFLSFFALMKRRLSSSSSFPLPFSRPSTTHHLLFPLHNNLSMSSPATRRTIGTFTTTTTNETDILVIMGPTGCGKSKLSVNLATLFSGEIINSDKIQLHRGLDITTNKIPLSQRNNIPHHLLGDFESSESHPEFTPSDYRSAASKLVSQIHSRRRTPFVVGGSNSYIYAFLSKQYKPDSDVFGDGDGKTVSFCKELRYRCCFIWVDVSLSVLNEYLIKRVDDMMESGMYEELEKYFDGLVREEDSLSRECGLRNAIGVAEFEKYFFNRAGGGGGGDMAGYEEAVKQIKDNTCRLAKRQLDKILRLRDQAGWDLQRVDATAAVRAAMGGVGGAEIWEKQVLEPSMKIVNRFLMQK